MRRILICRGTFSKKRFDWLGSNGHQFSQAKDDGETVFGTISFLVVLSSYFYFPPLAFSLSLPLFLFLFSPSR